jgi:hypothetical protein
MRIGVAFRAFMRALWDADCAAQLARVLAGESIAPAQQRAAEPRLAAPAKPAVVRSEAVTLLATLQREARFVDMVKEPLANYSDAQVGAAARDVLRDCGKVLDRLFGLAPLTDQEEGSEIEVPRDFDAASMRLTGHVTDSPPSQGRLVHHGWIATRCDLPAWTGSEATRLVVAPQEVEIA